MTKTIKQALFRSGQVVVTSNCAEWSARNHVNLDQYLARHLMGDWGDLNQADKDENEFSLKRGFRLFSAYDTPAGKVWIITEADRSSTCLLLPDDY